jgi:DNA-binding response OmpR family regulator
MSNAENQDRAAAPATGTRPRNILVIDDDLTIRELLRLHLGSAGFTVAVADDALVARRMLVGCTPDLLVVDIDMPQLNGLDFVTAFYADPYAQHIPVLFITASEELAQKAEALDADCLRKPFYRQVLLEAVTRSLNRKTWRNRVFPGDPAQPCQTP